MAIQTVGGVEVSSANDLESLTHGGDVMRSGIIFQFSNTILFVIIMAVTVLRFRQKRALCPQATWPLLVALCVSTVMVLLRNGYRIAELSGGWNGHLMRTETYLIYLDMVPMAIGVGVFVVFAPSFFFREDKKLDNAMEQLA